MPSPATLSRRSPRVRVPSLLPFSVEYLRATILTQITNLDMGQARELSRRVSRITLGEKRWPSSPTCEFYPNRKSLSLLSESSKVRKSALPSPVLLHKNIRRPLLRGEGLPAEFSLGRSQRRDNSSVSVDANSGVIGLHHFVGQGTGLQHAEEGRPVDYASVRVDDDPVIGKESTDCLNIIFHNRLRKFLFEF